MRFAFLSVLVTVFLTGCAGSFKPITQVDLNKYQEISTTSVVKQEEIMRHVTLSNSASQSSAQFGFIGGIIGGIVDASINDGLISDAEREMEPFRILMADFDSREVIQSELEGVLKKLKWSKNVDFKSASSLEKAALKSKLRSVEQDGLLTVNTTYMFAENLEYIVLRSDYAFYEAQDKEKNKNSRSKPSPTYQNTVIYYTETLDNLSREERATLWKANNAEKIKASIKQGAEQIASLILMDLNGEHTYSAEEIEKGKLKPIIISETEERKVSRSTDGSITSSHVAKML